MRRARQALHLFLSAAVSRAVGFRPRRRGFGLLTALLCAVGCTSPAPAQTPPERSRGVRLLDPGDEMTPLSAVPGVGPGASGEAEEQKLDTVRIAVADGDASLLASLAPHAAPFEIVAAAANPDIIWSAASRNVSAAGTTIAYGVSPTELPAVIDRIAVARGLAKLIAARPQPIRLVSGSLNARQGQNIEIEAPNVLRRALVLFDIAGNGAVQALYPLGSDERIVQTPSFRWSFQVREPFGADLIVAVTSAQPMEALERGLKQLSHYRSAGEILKLIAATAPPDARIGSFALVSAP